jgi:hypothetical protein
MLKPKACSLSELSRELGISRGSLYNLIHRGVYPKPRLLSNNRPFFDPDQVASIFKINETGVGSDGNYFLFYARVSKPTSQELPEDGSDIFPEILEGLKALGMSKITLKELRKTLAALYPSGTEGIDSGVILRAVFRHFRSERNDKP